MNFIATKSVSKHAPWQYSWVIHVIWISSTTPQFCSWAYTSKMKNHKQILKWTLLRDNFSFISDKISKETIRLHGHWFHEKALFSINEHLILLCNFRAYRAHLYRRSCRKLSVYVQQASSSSSNVVKENPGCVRVSNRASLWGVKRSRAEGPTKLNIAMVCPQCACNNNHTHRWCVYYE